MKRNLLLSITAAALAACSSAVAPARDSTSQETSAQSGARTETVSIRLGQSTSLDGGRLQLSFDARVADSRCPANVVCVWAGDAHIRLTTRVAGGVASTGELHSTLEPSKIIVDRYTISMSALTPYPGTGQDGNTPVVTLRVDMK